MKLEENFPYLKRV